MAQARRSIYRGWVAVAIAALAMVATLPGRTFGLGAITESLLRDLRLTHTQFGTINLVGTLIGAAFSFGVGRLVDKLGARVVLSAVALAFGGVVLASAWLVRGYDSLLVSTTLARGLGQSALSVVAVAVVGKWFVRRLGTAMAAFTLLVSVGFMIATPALEYGVSKFGWRAAWAATGTVILCTLLPLAAAVLRDSPESVGLEPDGEGMGEWGSGAVGRDERIALSGSALAAALRSPLFWAYAACGFLFSVFFNGFVLFRESVLGDLGLPAGTTIAAVAALAGAGLLANFAAGYAAQRFAMNRVAGAAMAVLAVSAALLPHARTPAAAIAVAALIGFGGGAMTVVFFASWGDAFGRSDLGLIQGFAQFCTVLGSALGPLMLAHARERWGGYGAGFYTVAPALLLAGAVTAVLPRPRATAG